MLTASERKEDAMAALRMGAYAIVQKRYAVETLMEAIRSAARGLVWVPPDLQGELAAELRITHWQAALQPRTELSSAVLLPGFGMGKWPNGSRLARARSRRISTTSFRSSVSGIASNWRFMRIALDWRKPRPASANPQEARKASFTERIGCSGWLLEYEQQGTGPRSGSHAPKLIGALGDLKGKGAVRFIAERGEVTRAGLPKRRGGVRICVALWQSEKRQQLSSCVFNKTFRIVLFLLGYWAD